MSLVTETFTAFPDFQGSTKAIIGDFLILPSTLGVFVMLYVFLRFPKHIELNEAASVVTFDGHEVDNPVEITIQSNKKNDESYRLIVTSQEKRKLKTGFIYKISDDSEVLNSSSSGQNHISFADK